jgi:hypothetical protein
VSAPTSHDPLVVNTRDGVCWTRRTVTSGGLALYAPEGVCKCPEFVMATLAELAEHGIVGSADVLPVPVVRNPVPLSGPICSQSEAHAAGLDVAPSVEELDAMAESVVALGDPLSVEVSLAQAVPLLGAAVTGLRVQVAALLEERHVTNEALDDAVRELRARQSCSCPSVDQPGPHQVGCPQAEVPGRSVEVSADRLSRFFAPVASLREDPHDSPLHHSYRVPRDLPEMGGA